MLKRTLYRLLRLDHWAIVQVGEAWVARRYNLEDAQWESRPATEAEKAEAAFYLHLLDTR